MNFIKKYSDGSIISILALPASSRNVIVGIHGDALKIKVSTAPSGGKANKAIISLLSNKLKIPKSDIEILSGVTQRKKTFLIKRLDPARIIATLNLILK